MALDDPFFVVREEVQKNAEASKALYNRWCELADQPGHGSKEEYDWTTNELRNRLRSIEWDLEDLEETIGIVEKNPQKFTIDINEICERRSFIDHTKATVKSIKDHLSRPRKNASSSSSSSKEENGVRQALLKGFGNDKNKYTLLDSEVESYNDRFIEDAHSRQKLMVKSQDDQLDKIGSSVRVLKDMSHQIGNELDEQSVMLDEFAREMDVTEGKMEHVMKKMAKVLHMSSDRRQWIAIGVLLLVMVIVIILFFVL